MRGDEYVYICTSAEHVKMCCDKKGYLCFVIYIRRTLRIINNLNAIRKKDVLNTWQTKHKSKFSR